MSTVDTSSFHLQHPSLLMSHGRHITVDGGLQILSMAIPAIIAGALRPAKTSKVAGYLTATLTPGSIVPPSQSSESRSSSSVR